MISFDPSLQLILNTATSKTDWAAKLSTALGGQRQLTGVVTSNTSSTSQDGVFMSATLSGDMTTSAGNIVGFGALSAVVVSKAVDLSQGNTKLRLAGNGHWLEGSLGLSGSAADFQLRANPIVGDGLGFGSTLKILAPKYLSSGTGPSAPPSGVNEPVSVALENWADFNNPVLVDTITFDTRELDLVFDDTEIASNMGDVKIRQCSRSIVHGDFEFGATLFALNSSLNDEANEPVYQVLIACKPYNRWASYPAEDTYNIATDTTFPPPFKIKLSNQSGALLHTFELRDGLAINDKRQPTKRDASKPLRPLFNCGMMLPWQSSRIKQSSYAKKYFAGMTADSIRQSQMKSGDAVNAAIPLIAGRMQINSTLHWYALPRWPMVSDDAYSNNAGNHNAEDPNADPWLFNVPTYYSGTASEGTGKIARAVGWDYEPGSISGHDWFTGPGGPRFDRAVVPTPLALYMSDPQGRRLKGNEPYQDLCRAWGLAYFNHSHHYTRDVKRFDTIPDEQILATQWSHGVLTYYGQGSNYVPGGLSRHVNLHAIVNGGDIPPRDKDNRMQWNGWMVDYHHNYCQPGWWALMFNSPMHLYSAKLRFHANIMAQLGNGPTSQPSFFLVRIQAWRYLHYVMMWKLGTLHRLGMARAGIESRLQAELESLHDQIYVPAMVDKAQDVANTAVRNLGVYTTSMNTDGTLQWYTLPTALTFYMGSALMLFKQTGLWAVMQAKSEKCKTALNFIVECLDKSALDMMVATEGRAEHTSENGSTPMTAKVPVGQQPVVPANWQEWNTLYPKQGADDWITYPNGNPRAPYERDVGMHMRAQWAFIHRDYFPEITRANLNEACAMYDSFYARRAQNLGQGDWHYRYPSLGIIKGQA